MGGLPENRVTDFFREHHVLTLATSVNDEVYCANCFYVYLVEQNSFVFSSDLDTKHINDVLQNPKVAASVVLETKTIGKIQGAQIKGKLIEAKGEELKIANKAYLKAFPYAILKSTKLWILNVEFIKMTDNRLGFGKKLIWEKVNLGKRISNICFCKTKKNNYFCGLK